MEPTPPHSRLSQSQHEAQQQQQAAQTTQTLEFGSAEELIRHDARRTLPPPALEERLRSSINAEPAPPASWWKRWFQR